jgi:hypothetical protein
MVVSADRTRVRRHWRKAQRAATRQLEIAARTQSPTQTRSRRSDKDVQQPTDRRERCLAARTRYDSGMASDKNQAICECDVWRAEKEGRVVISS